MDVGWPRCGSCLESLLAGIRLLMHMESSWGRLLVDQAQALHVVGLGICPFGAGLKLEASLDDLSAAAVVTSPPSIGVFIDSC